MTQNEKAEKLLATTKIIFGPINSRRLGISLGIDLIPAKTCTYNCVYCECGKTTDLTLKRRNFFTTKSVIKAIKKVLQNKQHIDYITFSGSGEPTLAKNIGEIITYLKKNYPQYKIAVLTNGSLFSKLKVRKDLLSADLIVPTFNTINPITFEKIQQPSEQLKIKNIINGLIKFRKEFKNQIWLELFIIPGMNDTINELKALKKQIEKIKPDKIQINTIDRPGTEKWVIKPTQKEIIKISKFFTGFSVEIIEQQNKPVNNSVDFLSENKKIIEANIIEILKRRPSRNMDLLIGLSIKESKLDYFLNKLSKENLILTEKINEEIFYKMRQSE